MRFPQLCVPLKADGITRPLSDYFARADLIEIAHGGIKFLLDAQSQIQFVDVDHTRAAQLCPIIKRLLPSCKTIVSFHDFEATPSNLAEIVSQLRSIPADLYKIATLARSSLDVFRLLDLLKTDDALVVIPMGPIGQFGRVLAPLFGSKISFAPMTAQDSNAPGQLTLDLLLDTYRFRSLSEQTVLCGLIGDPVEQSVGEIFHNILMQHGVYVKMVVKPDQLALFLQKAKRFGFRGLSVTMPLKEVILPYLDAIDSKARRIAAVNTVHFKDGKLIGYNTDGMGALEALEKAGGPVLGKRIVLLGAGGSARAIAFEGMARGAEVAIYNRTESRAKQVAQSLGCLGGGAEVLKERYDILINCTPDGLPIDPDLILPGKLVMDISVNPTRLLSIARSKQCRVVDGMQMYVQQALLQRAIWF